MKRAILTLVPMAAIACVILGAGSAPASSTFSTKITHDATVPLGNGEFILTGHLRSRKSDCLYLRLVKPIGHRTDGSRKMLDFDVTSLHGAWAAKAKLSGIDRVKAKVVKTSTENGDVCQADTVVFSVP